jgi:hypothetical protein
LDHNLSKGDNLPLSPVVSGERAEVGRFRPAEADHRPAAHVLDDLTTERAAASGPSRTKGSGDDRAPIDILHLAELVPVVRARFSLSSEFSDDAILASLRAITSWSEQRGRWRAAFNSNLGYALAIGGRDLNTALNTLLTLLPRPLS